MGKDAEIISAALVPASRAHGPERYVPKHLRCCLAFRLDDAAQPHSIACGLVSMTASLSLGPASRAPHLPPPLATTRVCVSNHVKWSGTFRTAPMSQCGF